MNASTIAKSLLSAALVTSAASLGLAADSLTAPRVRAGVSEVIALRLNLATGLIKALDSNLVCDVDAYPTSINEQVTTAWSQATAQQKSAFLAKVPAKSIIRKDMAFRIAVEHVDLSEKTSLEKFARSITGTRFFVFGSGVFGSRYNVTLGRDGRAQEQRLEVLEKEPWMKWHASQTTWSVEKNKGENGERFMIKIGNKLYTIQRDAQGEVRLVPPGVKKETPEYLEQTLTSSDSYCEA